MAAGRSRRHLVAAGVAAGIVVALGVLFLPPLTADGGDPTLIHACVKNVNGQVRIVGSSDTCLPSEHAAHWPASSGGGAAAGSIMVHGGGFGSGGVAVNFVHLGGGIPVYRSPRDGVIQNVRILVRSNSYDGSTPVTVVVNDVPTPLTAVIPAGSTANIDVPGTFAITDGDRVSVVLDRGASTVGSLELSVAYEIL